MTTSLNTRLNFAGSLATVRLSHGGESDGIAVIEHRMPHGYAPPLHVHLNQDEVFHVLSGRMCVEVNGTFHHAGAGDLLKAPKGGPHRFIVTSEEGVVALTITAGPDFESFVRAGSTPVVPNVPFVPGPPNPDQIALLSAAAMLNSLELLGPPLTLADLQQRAA